MVFSVKRKKGNQRGREREKKNDGISFNFVRECTRFKHTRMEATRLGRERGRKKRRRTIFLSLLNEKKVGLEKQGDEGNERRDKARALITSLNGSFVRARARERAFSLLLSLSMPLWALVGSGSAQKNENEKKKKMRTSKGRRRRL